MKTRFDPRPAFTVSNGLAVQREQLAFWKVKLNAAAFAALQSEVDRQNSEIAHDADGYAVWRGGDMDQFVHNWGRDLVTCSDLSSFSPEDRS